MTVNRFFGFFMTAVLQIQSHSDTFVADSRLTFVGEDGHVQKSAIERFYHVEIEGTKSSKSIFFDFGDRNRSKYRKIVKRLWNLGSQKSGDDTPLPPTNYTHEVWAKTFLIFNLQSRKFMLKLRQECILQQENSIA